MSHAHIRRLVTTVDETHHVLERPVEPPRRKAVAVAVIANPYAGRFDETMDALQDIGEELGGLLGQRAVAALGVAPEAVTAYGKAALVGEDGELEHTAAIIHPRFGKPLRAAVGQGAEIIPATKKQGGMGTPIDVPLHNKNDAWDYSRIDTIQVCLPDAPRRDEIVVAVAVAEGPRPLFRIGGQSREEILRAAGLEA